MKASTEHALALCASLVLAGCQPHDHDGHGHDATHHEEDAGHGHPDDGHHHGNEGPDMGHDSGALDPDMGLTPEAFTYCDCMLVNCHDPYHERWGSDDVEARNTCAQEASAWPVTGSPQTSGDSVECRISVCEGVANRRNTCAEALGESTHPCS